MSIETTVNGEILEHGKIALDAKLFSEITRRVSSQNAVVTIESDDTKPSICKGYRDL